MLFLAHETYQISDQLKNQQAQVAEYHSARFGMLNAEVWAQQIKLASYKAVDTLDFTQYLDTFQVRMEKRMEEEMLDYEKRIEEELEKAEESGNPAAEWLKKEWIKIKEKTVDLYYDSRIEINKLFYKAMFRIIENEKESIKVTMKAEIDKLLESIEAPELDRPELISPETIQETRRSMHWGALLLLWFFLGYFPLMGLFRKWLGYSNRILAMDLVLFGMIALLIGISTPMLTIEAEVEKLEYSVMGINTVFEHQVLYHQSKSIMEVVTLLFSTKEYFVATLLLCFSILFPLLKLITSLWMLFSEKVRSSKWMRRVVLNIGKWSMADVFVVAIFLTFMAFNNVIDNQFYNLEQIEQVNVLTTNNSGIEIGFYFFLGYCILSILSSMLIGRILGSSQA